MSSTAEITRTEWARFGLVLLGLTRPNPEGDGWALRFLAVRRAYRFKRS
jgi:hypothetical protein